MNLNPKLTWGLAWAGLALVVAVPTVDFVTGMMGSDRSAAAVLTSDIDAVTPGPSAPAASTTVTTTKTANGVIITPTGAKSSVDPVDRFVDSGKPLPDYITGGSAPAPSTAAAAPSLTLPGTSATAPAASTPTQVAAIDPAVVPKPTAPTPFPVWARPVSAPAPVVTADVAPTAPVVTAPTLPTVTTPVATTPPAATLPAEPIVIVDERATGSIQSPTRPTPPAPIVDDSENWDTESLRQYLERRGILDGSSGSSASVNQTQAGSDDLYFDDAPRSTRETRRQRLDRLLRESGDDPQSFTLF